MFSDTFEDSTSLSQPEIARLSIKIGGRYDELGRLANLNEVENVTHNNVQLPRPDQKAAKVLEMINNKWSFSRKKLADYLKEMNLENLAEEVLRGTLRYPDKQS